MNMHSVSHDVLGTVKSRIQSPEFLLLKYTLIELDTVRLRYILFTFSKEGTKSHFHFSAFMNNSVQEHIYARSHFSFSNILPLKFHPAASRCMMECFQKSSHTGISFVLSSTPYPNSSHSALKEQLSPEFFTKGWGKNLF